MPVRPDWKAIARAEVVVLRQIIEDLEKVSYTPSCAKSHCQICGKILRDPERVMGIGLGEAMEATDTAHFCLGHVG